jgi:hypothetical protein
MKIYNLIFFNVFLILSVISCVTNKSESKKMKQNDNNFQILLKFKKERIFSEYGRKILQQVQFKNQ